MPAVWGHASRIRLATPVPAAPIAAAAGDRCARTDIVVSRATVAADRVRKRWNPPFGNSCWPPSAVSTLRASLLCSRSLRSRISSHALRSHLCVVWCAAAPERQGTAAVGRRRSRRSMMRLIETSMDWRSRRRRCSGSFRRVFRSSRSSASPVVRISLRRVPGRLCSSKRGRGARRALDSALPRGSLAEFHLMVVQRVVALSRASLQPARGGRAEPVARPALPRRSRPSRDSDREPREPARRDRAERRRRRAVARRCARFARHAGSRYALSRRIA